MKHVRGNLITLALAGQFDVIVHGCNCHCKMGAGIAKAIKEVFPEAYQVDGQTRQGDRDKMGTCSCADCTVAAGRLVVVNAYTQFHWRGQGVKVDYEAVRSCMAWIKKTFPGQRIGIPRIGAGLAGGDWQRIAMIIDEELAGADVTCVEYAPAMEVVPNQPRKLS